MTPSDTTNDIIGGVLAKALNLFDVELFACVFVSNHFHLLLRSKRLEIPAFMQYLRGNIAKKMGRHVDWTGKFWHRRYDAEPVIDDDALLGRLRYILAHGVKEGLVAHCRQWPGLTSIPELLDGTTRTFCWPSANKSSQTTVEAYPLSVAPLPCWQDADASTRRVRVNRLIAGIEKEAYDQRPRKPPLGRTAVLAQRPHDKPEHIKRSLRPLCHASTREAYRSYKAEYCSFVESYAEALAEYRRTRSVLSFPVLSYHPPGVKPVMPLGA